MLHASGGGGGAGGDAGGDAGGGARAGGGVRARGGVRAAGAGLRTKAGATGALCARRGTTATATATTTPTLASRTRTQRQIRDAEWHLPSRGGCALPLASWLVSSFTRSSGQLVFDKLNRKGLGMRAASSARCEAWTMNRDDYFAPEVWMLLADREQRYCAGQLRRGHQDLRLVPVARPRPREGVDGADAAARALECARKE